MQEAPSSFTAEQKAAIVRRHLVDEVSVSDRGGEYILFDARRIDWLASWTPATRVALSA
jgi:hypothetical protein